MKWETEGCCSHQFSRKNFLLWFLCNSVFLRFMIHRISLLLWWFCNRISAFYSTVSGRQLHLGDFLRHQEWREGEIFHDYVRNLKEHYQIILGFQNHFFYLFVPSFYYFPSKWEIHLNDTLCNPAKDPVSSDDRNRDREVSSAGLKFVFENIILWLSANIYIFKSDYGALKQMVYNKLMHLIIHIPMRRLHILSFTWFVD